MPSYNASIGSVVFKSKSQRILHDTVIKWKKFLVTGPLWGFYHDDVIKWKHFPRYRPFVRGIHRSPVNSPHKGQWRRALMFSLICPWINGWVNNREAGDLRRHRAHYDVVVMCFLWSASEQTAKQTIEKLMIWDVMPLIMTLLSLHWRHNDHDSVSNHQPRGCLLNLLFRRKYKKTSKLRVTGLCVGNSPGPVNSPHKGPVTRKMFPFDDVIM